MRSIGKKIQEKFENFLAVICRRSSVLKFSLPLDPRLRKMKKKIVKISIFKISKIPNVVLCGPLGRKFRKAFRCNL